MLPPEVRCVVGIDVAKAAHVVCALDAPSGTVRLKSTPLPATAAGHAQLVAWLESWAAGNPARLLIGMESTGSLWEPLYDALTQVGYVVLLLNPTDVFGIGCLLSFLSVAVLTWGTGWLFEEKRDPLAELIDTTRPVWLRALRRLGRWVAVTYAISVVIWLAVTPLAASRYNSAALSPVQTSR